MKRALLLLLLLIVFGGSARADAINTVNINATLQTNSATNETFATSFDWDASTDTLMPGMTVSTQGPLGPFALVNSSVSKISMSWVDARSDAINLNFSWLPLPTAFNFNTPGTFPDGIHFVMDLVEPNTVPSEMSALDGSIVITGPVSTPEAPTLLLLLAGIVALVIVRLAGAIA